MNPNELLAKLPDRDRLILTMRFALGGGTPMTLQAIGEKLNISRGRVRQLQNIALRRLKRAIQLEEASQAGES